ncbi:MAG: gas vesicle protein GvpL [Candidatus Thermoplasmatota archaeon]
MDEGRYLYCIVNNCSNENFGDIGIEESNVYTIVYKDIGAVVHKCAPKPYETKDEKVVKEWLLAHQYVIDEATKKFGTVIPFSFDTIVKGDEEKVKLLLEEEYNTFKDRLEKFKDKAEYTVQIFSDESAIMKEINENYPEIKKSKEEIEKKSKGTAYMLNKKLEAKIKEIYKDILERYAKEFYANIKNHVDDIKVDSKNKPVPDKWKDKQMVINLFCLVHKDKVDGLGRILDELNKKEGFSVRFTGPWAPFSFVCEEIGRRKA